MKCLAIACAVLAIAVVATPAARADPPQIKAVCVGAQSCGGWFVADVHLRWVIDGGDPVLGCDETWIRTDTPPTGLVRDCSAEEPGTHDPASARVTIRLDKTPPTVTDAMPDRATDHAGWYRSPVTFTARGTDAASGIAACERATYGGPDNAAATIVATCRDVAGHVASRAFPLRYDATPPDPAGATSASGDRIVRLRWPAVASASVVRTPGFDGEPSSVLTPAADGMTDVRVRNGVAYRYVVTLADEAGNAASRELVVTAGPRLLAPVKRAVLAAPPLLRWTAVRGARYYNVQLFRRGRKILSAWPKRPQLQLRETWRFRGRRYRLTDGRYQWYAWPGEGPRSANKYGKRIGARSFVLDRGGAG